MTVSNTVLKLNIKGHGDSLVWLFSDPVMEDSEVERLFPSIPDKAYGPNLTFVCRRLSNQNLFLSTTSAWKSNDEFGREGIALSQGLLVESSHGTRITTLDICNTFALLLRIHQFRHQTLGDLLEHLATQGNLEEAKKMAAGIFDSVSKGGGGYTGQLILSLADYLKTEVDKQDVRMRVETRFPWSEELGFFALIGLQHISDGVHSVAGGRAISSGSYQHISTPQEVPGFRYINLNELLTCQVKMKRSTTKQKGYGEPDRNAYAGSLLEPNVESAMTERGKGVPWRKILRGTMS